MQTRDGDVAQIPDPALHAADERDAIMAMLRKRHGLLS